MTLEFLSPHPGGSPGDTPPAASPLEPWLVEAGARLEERRGWRVAVDFGDAAAEARTCRDGVAVADRSQIGKLELQGPAEAVTRILDGLLGGSPPAPGESARLEGAEPAGGLIWSSSPDRVLAVCEPAATAEVRALLGRACDQAPNCGLVELTAGLAALEVRGSGARSLLERLTAIDVRDAALPPLGVRPGRVAEVPGVLLRTEPDAFLILVGAPEAPDVWEIVLDAGEPLGLCPVGEDARSSVRQPAEEVGVRA
jgi:aminomethyltransferase